MCRLRGIRALVPGMKGEAPRCYVGGCEGYRYGVAIAQGLCIVR